MTSPPEDGGSAHAAVGQLDHGLPFDLLPWWRFVMERAESRDELALAQTPGRLDGHGPVAPVLDIGRDKLTGESIADMTGPQDDHVLVVRESTRDLLDETSEVFLAVSFQRALGRASTTVTDVRSVTDMTRRAMARRDVGSETLEVDCTAGPSGDDGFASIDPDEGDVARALSAAPVGTRLPSESSVARVHPHDRVPPSSNSSVIRRSSDVICRTA